MIIFAFRAKLPDFLAFLQFHSGTSNSGKLPDIFLFSFSVTESSSWNLFLLIPFVPLKVTAISSGWIVQCTSISEIKCRWKWRPQGLWVPPVFACLPRFSVWIDVLTKIQRSLFCISFCQRLAVLQHLPIYLLWVTCPKSSAQSAEDEMSLITTRWACSSSHGVSFSPCPHGAWVLWGTVSKLGRPPSCLFLCLNRLGRRWGKKKIFSWFYLVLTTKSLISVTFICGPMGSPFHCPLTKKPFENCFQDTWRSAIDAASFSLLSSFV